MTSQLRAYAVAIGATITGFFKVVMSRGGEPAVALTAGDRAPDFSLQGSDGSTYHLHDLAGHLVLFGGLAAGVGPEAQLGDTWTWDGGSWTEQHPAQRASGGEVSVMVSGGSGAVLLFGVGDLAAHKVDQQTWRWNGQDWAALITAHSRANIAALASARFVGLGDRDGAG